MLTNTMTSTQTSLLPPRTRRSSFSRSYEGRDHQAQLDHDERRQQQRGSARSLAGSSRRASRSPRRRARAVAPGCVRHCTDPAGRAVRPLLDSRATRRRHRPPTRPAARPQRRIPMTDDRERWALILGASSGMGEATSLALAAAGYRIVGIHLDFRAGAGPRRGDQGGDRGRRQRGPLHQHERGRRREAGRRDRDDPGALRREPRGRPAPLPPHRHALARVRVARAVPRRRSRRKRSTARRWR